MPEELTSLVYDIDVRGDSKWLLLTEPQRARFIERIFDGATLDELLAAHDKSVEINASAETKKGSSEITLAEKCDTELKLQKAEGRAHVWSTRGVSEFSKLVRDARTRVVSNAHMVAALANQLTEIERKTNVTITEGALKLRAAAMSKIATGIANQHTAEGQALLSEGTEQLIAIRNTELRAEEGKGRVALKKEELKMAERKLQLLEKKVAEAQAVVESKKLSPDEQRARLREILKPA